MKNNTHTILVTGIGGQLGYDVMRELTFRGIPAVGTDREKMDFTDEAAVRRVFKDVRPTALIHCAAYTAVDAAEEDADRCFLVNETGTRILAEACREYDIPMMYFSTDYVFPGEGERFYEADDPTGPLGIYGKSKLAGEEALRETWGKHFILRTSWVFGIHGKNFVKTMLKLAENHTQLSVVADQVGSPTYTPDLARLACDMILTEAYGTYHATNEGVTDWAHFAETIFAKAGIDGITVRHVTTEEYGAKAPRPKNSRLSKKALTDAGFAGLPSWEDALVRYLDELRAEKA